MFTHWWIWANDHWFKILTQMDGFPIASYTTGSGMWMRHKQYWHNNSKRSDLSPKPIAVDFLNFQKTSWNKIGCEQSVNQCQAESKIVTIHGVNGTFKTLRNTHFEEEGRWVACSLDCICELGGLALIDISAI